MPTLSDERLLKKAKQGCKESMQQIYEQNKGPLMMCAKSMIFDKDAAEDIVHDVYVSFARSVKTLRIRGSLKAYLCAGVCNRARDLLRRKQTRERHSDQLAADEQRQQTPYDQLALEEATLGLKQALQKLPWEQREVLLLRTKADMTFNEIASHQRISANAAQARFRYGIGKLRIAMNADDQRRTG